MAILPSPGDALGSAWGYIGGQGFYDQQAAQGQALQGYANAYNQYYGGGLGQLGLQAAQNISNPYHAEIVTTTTAGQLSSLFASAKKKSEEVYDDFSMFPRWKRKFFDTYKVSEGSVIKKGEELLMKLRYEIAQWHGDVLTPLPI